MGAPDRLRLWWLLWLFFWRMTAGQELGEPGSSFTLYSVNRRDVLLRPYDWTYLRVDVPAWFSSMTMIFISSVDISKEHVKQLPKSKLPVICFNQGSLPLPDISNTYLDTLLSNFITNGSSNGAQFLQNMEQCIPFQKNLTMLLTKDQVSPGVWYIGFFNGLGPERTQSKMINRGESYSISTSITVKGCASSTLWGPYCNQTIDMVSCSQPGDKHPRSLLDVNLYKNCRDLLRTSSHLLSDQNSLGQRQDATNSNVSLAAEYLVNCDNPQISCLADGELKFYFLDIAGPISHFIVTAAGLKLNQTSSSSAAGFDGILLMCYARFNGMPLSTLNDQFADISRGPLVIKSPKIGRWYVALQVLNQKKGDGLTLPGDKLCFSIQWQLHQCLNGKTGLNCTWEVYMLQRVIRRGSSERAYYLPLGSSEDAAFNLNNRLSNSSIDNVAWTYFFLDVPYGAAGSNMHVQLTSDKNVNFEIYSRYGGAASIESWDYYVNNTSNSNESRLLTQNDISKGRIEFYLFNVKEGIWSFGLCHAADISEHQSTLSISLEACPKHCSFSGQCEYSTDESGLTIYSFCSCDGNHGGFDCSNELVSAKGHIWHLIFLVASNGAAILPAFWSIRQKAFSEWVIFTSSGISSGLYHACDVGSWCALSFHALQFMDFWLSFMAVVSTFVFMATIDEASKRAIHTIVAIVTALLAENGATRSENVVIVIAIGSLGLLVGWLLEYSAASRIVCPTRLDFDMIDSWQIIKRWCWNTIKILHKRFRWPFMILGFVGLALAGTSWSLETSGSYWFWHSLWHISIYTASFFFLCSTTPKKHSGSEESEYELTRQDSSSRD
ncbi:hypothetical protein AXF42_Ash016885 [Apostasia shenzhenica]|uniref:EGF-like domain-containing protein n=1 Tax=Apostasia shenzhenica TaxID=1088818 RepID=A0A2H9ZRE8_9ASPA|nr:hypothetical protein AXF42_Ash016885 [Apostasia shenzhenica]